MTASTPAESAKETQPHHVEVRTGAYADSVALLQVSKDVAATEGVAAAQVAMATPLNLEVLAQMGFTLPETTPNDMVVALQLTPEGRLTTALAAVDAALAATASRPSEEAVTEPPRTTRSALRRHDSTGADASDLVLISVPGPHALPEAMDALDAGHDVMVFSDNVPLEQEVALKRLAAERGRLVMGPDCGTAVVGGLGLGFANVVEPGPVGIVAASGTGCQQLLALLDHAGVGVGAALGVGGRDLSAKVGGLSTRESLRRLDTAPAIELIVVVSKPPAPEVAVQIEEYADSLTTPVQLALLGEGRPDLTQAAESALETLGVTVPEWPRWQPRPADAAPSATRGRALRGLFVGGTLCDEARLIATEALGPVDAGGHVLVDFGDDTLTGGRAHPMIDPTLRLEHIARVAADPETGVVLLDVVLGHSAEVDPAASLAPAVADAVATARAGGRDLPVVVACVGTGGDPQDFAAQVRTLADAGAEVHLSHAHAARRAVALIGGSR